MVLAVLVLLVVTAGGAGSWAFGVFDRYDSVPALTTLVTAADVTQVLGRDPGSDCRAVASRPGRADQRTCAWGDENTGTGSLQIDLDVFSHRGLSSGTRRAKHSLSYGAGAARDATRPDGVGDAAFCGRPGGTEPTLACVFRCGNVIGYVSLTSFGRPSRVTASRDHLIAVAGNVARRLAAR